jgi:hypothetical protein
MAAKAVSVPIPSSPSQYNIAVAGIQLTQPRLNDILTEAVIPCADSRVDCYFIDDGAVVVYATNFDHTNNNIGKFFGSETVEPQLMWELVNRSIFLQRETNNYQGKCYSLGDKQTSSGIRLLPSLVYELLSLNWWTATSTWTYLNFLHIYSWLFSSSAVQGDEMSAFGIEPEASSCIQVLNQYRFNTDIDASVSSSLSGSFLCSDDCYRSFAVTRLKSTNLMLVMVESTSICATACDTSPFTLLPFSPIKKTDDPLLSSAKCEATPRYRRRPECYQENPAESDSHCGGCVLTASLVCVLGAVASAVLFRTSL